VSRAPAAGHGRAATPILPRSSSTQILDDEVVAWTERLLRETRELMGAVLPFEAHELEFLERLNGAGDIAPELLTSEATMQAIIREHPGLRWKALNVKKHLGIRAGDDLTE
jgi:hypothetical protein